VIQRKIRNLLKAKMSLRVPKNGLIMRVVVFRPIISKVEDMILSVICGIPGAAATFGAEVPNTIIELVGSERVVWRVINPVGRFEKMIEIIAIMLSVFAHLCC